MSGAWALGAVAGAPGPMTEGFGSDSADSKCVQWHPSFGDEGAGAVTLRGLWSCA